MRTARIVDVSAGMRRLWEGLPKRSKEGGFRWDALCDADLENAEQELLRQTEASHSHFTSIWSTFLHWLDTNEIISAGIQWKEIDRTKRDRPDPKKVPRHEILQALADVYREHAVLPFHRLLICSLGLQQVAAFRMSELLLLPEDCWVEEIVNGRVRNGLRYWAEKTPNGSYKHAVRWLSPLGAELAAACLSEIRTLTESARKQARLLEREPDRVRIHLHREKLWLNRVETAAIFGMVPGSLAPLIRSGALRLKPRVTGYRQWSYRRHEIEHELLRRRPPLFTLQISGNKYQRLSETLLISFVYENDPQAGTSPLLVTSVKPSSLVGFIGGSAVTPSAFDLFNLHEKYGVHLRLHVHKMRHWLNTVANKSGMSAFQITLWMQRRSIAQTRLYLHDTREIAEIARNYVRGGNAIGPIADMYDRSAAPLKELRLEAVRDAHILESSLCTEQITRDGCDRGKLCEAECPKALWINGPETDRTALTRRKEGLTKALVSLKSRDGSGFVKRQSDIYRAAIKRLTNILAQLEMH